jgi:hypothetical protein
LAWTSEVPIAMVNESANLSENLQYLNAEKLLNSLNKTGYQLSQIND